MLAFGLYQGQSAAQLTAITPAVPRLTAHLVPVRAAAIAVDAAALQPRLQQLPGRPFVPAASVAGYLTADYGEWRAGQLVMGSARHGLQTTAWIDAASLVPLDADTNPERAVSLLIPGVAAVTALLEGAAVHPGQRLYVTDDWPLRMQITTAITTIFGLAVTDFGIPGQYAPTPNGYHAAIDFSATPAATAACVQAVMTGGTLATRALTPYLAGKVLRLNHLTARPKLTAAEAIAPVLAALTDGQLQLPAPLTMPFDAESIRRAYTLAQDPAQTLVVTP